VSVTWTLSHQLDLMLKTRVSSFKLKEGRAHAKDPNSGFVVQSSWRS
jgi:hypothetical protein